MAPPIDPQRLLRHTGWLRVLAVELVGDEGRAEDVLQETWLAAVRRPPDVGGDERRLRAWLARVVRNLSLATLRGEAHRAQRERRGARSEAQPSVEESLRRADLQRELLEAVMALEPAQREAVVLRYLDRLPPREIARRLGVSGDAVRSRLKRGLAALRARLDLEREDERRAWLLAFVPQAAAATPLAPLAPSASTLTLGGLLLKTQTQVLALLALSLGAAGTVVWWTGKSPAAPPPSPEVSAATPEEPRELGGSELDAPAAVLGDPGTPAAREALAPGSEGRPRRETPAPAVPRLRGRVIDPTSRPLAGLSVAFVGFGEMRERGLSTVADEEGAFALEPPGVHGKLLVDDPDWVTLLDVRLTGEVPAEVVELVAAPRRTYAGVILDEDGNALAGVPLRAVMDGALLRGLRPGVQRSEWEPSWSDVSDAKGEFELADVGWSEGTRLEVELAGYEPVADLLADRSVRDLRIVMRRPRGSASAIVGRVVDLEDEPVDGALVYLGESSTYTDRQGGFVLELTTPDGGTLRALRLGYLPAELDLDALPPVPEGGRRPPVELRLGDEPLRIAGRVVDASGAPIADANVWTFDGERLPRGDGFGAHHVEDVIGFRGDGLHTNRSVTTDAEGRFELSGLLPRPYLVWAMDPNTVEVVSEGSVEAGVEDLVLRVTGAPGRRVAGRIVSYAGDPIPDVVVLVARHGNHAAGEFYTPAMITSEITGEDGRFEFEALCVEGTYLLPASPNLAGGERIFLEEFDDVADLELRMPRRCLFQVLLEQDPTEADGLRVLDGDGEWLTLVVETSNMMFSSSTMNLADGRSEVLVTDERARTLVFLKDGRDVRRVPLQLEPGEVEILRF